MYGNVIMNLVFCTINICQSYDGREGMQQNLEMQQNQREIAKHRLLSLTSIISKLVSLRWGGEFELSNSQVIPMLSRDYILKTTAFCNNLYIKFKTNSKQTNKYMPIPTDKNQKVQINSEVIFSYVSKSN
jgi:hypothetical protein